MYQVIWNKGSIWEMREYLNYNTPYGKSSSMSSETNANFNVIFHIRNHFDKIMFAN